MVILEDLNFIWSIKEIDTVKRMWNEGDNFKSICQFIKRPGDEVFLLLLHLSRNRSIRHREGFIWSNQ